MLRNQVCSLIFEGRIKTSVTKAKETRRLAERMVTLGKSGTLHHRRRAISKLHNVEAVGILFDEIAPQYREREGGYTRIIRAGHRQGDAAEQCFLEFVEAEVQTTKKKKIKQKTAEAPVEEVVEEEAVTEEAAEEETAEEEAVTEEAAEEETAEEEAVTEEAAEEEAGTEEAAEEEAGTEETAEEEAGTEETAEEETAEEEAAEEEAAPTEENEEKKD
jgi:large subunit ribosomal protein L17